MYQPEKQSRLKGLKIANMRLIHEWEPTKSSPGRYSWMLNELAKIDGVENTKRITFSSKEQARKNKVKYTDMLFTINGNEIMCQRVEIRTGGIQVFVFGTFEIPTNDYTGPVSIVVSKSIKEYTARPKPAGSYKNCEGGGWYSMANLYELNGKYYTDAY